MCIYRDDKVSMKSGDPTRLKLIALDFRSIELVRLDGGWWAGRKAKLIKHLYNYRLYNANTMIKQTKKCRS